LIFFFWCISKLKNGGIIIMKFMSFLSKVYLFRIFGLNLFKERRRRKKKKIVQGKIKGNKRKENHSLVKIG
jgi:hypothetical protein